MNYHNVISAVVRALAAETINSSGGCNVEPRVQASKLKGEISGKDAALLADCIVHKLLHAQLAPRHWNALVAKYSTTSPRWMNVSGTLAKWASHAASRLPCCFFSCRLAPVSVVYLPR